MRSGSFVWLGIVVLCAACSGSSSDTTGSGATGGSGGSGGSGGTGGSAGSTTTTTTGSGGTGGCAAPASNVYDNAVGATATACEHPVVPLASEDGTFAVTVFGPFAAPFQLDGFSFAAWEGDSAMPSDPWTASVVVVPAGSDPLAVNPNDAAKPYPLTLLETLPITQGTIHRYSIKLDAPLSVAACDTVVVALRNTVGPPLSALDMCGTGSTHPETSQWWNLDGTMSTMASFGTEFDRDWWVSLLPTAGE